MAITTKRIEKNLQAIGENINSACARAGRDPREVRIVAVTKSVEIDVIKKLIDAGKGVLAENRMQQLVPRVKQIKDYLGRRKSPPAEAVEWHMIGHLQRNKVKAAIENSTLIHSVDSLRLAEEVNDRAAKLGVIANVLLQVNCSREPQKYGCAIGAAYHLGEMMDEMKNIQLCGLMTMGPMSGDPVGTRNAFTRLSELFQEMRNDKIGGEHFRELSMGMSGDYKIAVEEGATLVRIGSAIFE